MSEVGISYEIDVSDVSIKTYLRKHKGISSRALIKLKSSGIYLNEKPAKVIDIMKKGDVLRIVPDGEKTKLYEPENIKLSVIYEDENFIVIDKPPFMAMYPVGKHEGGSLLNAFSYKYKDLVFRPIYRLDRNTSGLVCLAKNKIAASAKIEKKYFAVCEGICPTSGIIDTSIGLSENSKIKREVGHGKSAKTQFEKISEYDGHCLINLTIYTGRTHQIRVHMSSLGFPLAGDDLYGGDTNIIKRQALHCGKINIVSEALDFEKEILVEMPKDIKEAFKGLFKEE